MSASAEDLLVLAWGNPGRLDDGLGPAFAEAVADLELPGVAVESVYQLSVEHAAQVASVARVLFVDADRSPGTDPFRLDRLHPSDGPPAFTTHAMAPGAVLAVARDLFDGRPEAWLLGIRGEEFDEFGERLSDRARLNLVLALVHVVACLRRGDLFGSCAPTAVAAATTAPSEVKS